MVKVEIQHPSVNSNTITEVVTNQVQIDLNKNIDSKPEPNNFALREIQDLSAENMAFIIEGELKEDEQGKLDLQNLLDLYQVKYNGSNPIKLFITYNNDDELTGVADEYPIDTVLAGVDGLVLNINRSKDLKSIPFQMSLIETK